MASYHLLEGLLLLLFCNNIRGGTITCTCKSCEEDKCEDFKTQCEAVDGYPQCGSGPDANFRCSEISCDVSLDDGASGGLDDAYGYNNYCAALCTGFDCSGGSKDENTCDDGKKKNKCFHEDSVITYKGREYTFQQLKNGLETECTVPHVAYTSGLSISTSCNQTVSVTPGHLLYTPAGYKPAYELQPGDSLYTYDNGICTVTASTYDSKLTHYFGLNCLDSTVFVNGVSASTFGETHLIPSLYMWIVGNVMGVKFASSLGDTIAELVLPVYHSLY